MTYNCTASVSRNRATANRCGIASRSHQYDTLGRPTSRTLARQGATRNDVFTYNDRSELISDVVHGTGLNGWDYDLAVAPPLQAALAWQAAASSSGVASRPVLFSKEGEDLTVACTYDYMGRRATKVVTENGQITSSHRFLYRGYLQIACCDRTRANHPCLWLITWDPTQPIATRPLAIQKDGTWYTYGWDLTKNIWETYTTTGYIGTAYTYTAYGQVTASGAVEQPIQWSSEYNDAEMGMVYYNYRHYVCRQGLFSSRDAKKGIYPQMHPYKYSHNQPMHIFDHLGMDVFVRNTPAALYFHWKICVSEWELAPAGYKGISCCWKKQRYVKKDTFYCIGFGPHMKHEMWPSCRGVDDTESRHPYGNPVNGGTPMPPEMKNVNGEGANGVVTTNNAVTDRETGKPGHLQDIKTSCAEDIAIKSHFEGQVGQTADYWFVGGKANCRWYAYYMYNYVIREIINPSRIK